jgi:hypothetical protein
MKFCWILVSACLLGCAQLVAQRTYRANSVLAEGAWYKIGVTAQGVYKIDLALLNKLGINVSNLPSSAVRLYGNGGGMLPENPREAAIDDLPENSLWVEDGGDGVLNGADYLLFYAPGPHQWQSTPFRYRKNLYSDTAYYFIQIAASGKRITTFSGSAASSLAVTSYDYRYHYESDTFNFLSSGKQWFGEEFSTLPGRSLSRIFSVPMPGPGPHLLNVAARFVGRVFSSGSSITVKSGSQNFFQETIPPVGAGPYDLFAQEVKGNAAGWATSGNALSLEMQLVPTGSGGQAWLDWFALNGRSALSFTPGRQFFFRDQTSVSVGSTVSFRITCPATNIKIWDITNAADPVNMALTKEGNDWIFTNDVSVLREYAGFSNETLLQPVAVGRINNQNLHALSSVPLIVVTSASLRSQANRLASFHRERDGMRSAVVSTEEIFNEFSSGSPAPTAIRDFLKMFHDRAGSDTSLRPRYLLLFGAGSFDYKNRLQGNTRLVPAYESEESLDPLNTYTTDDFFGMLDDNDDINGTGVPLLDIGIGRIPASTIAEATAYVDKLFAYRDTSSLGPWRTNLTFVADDEDNNLHLQDAETITQVLQKQSPSFSIQKIYLDAYTQQSGAGGSRYPEAGREILNTINDGTLVWNYTGHGGYRRLAEEVVLDQEMIASFSNARRLPLFITATCDVAPHDNPLVNSIGEDLLLRPQKGAIALMTTTRLVFAFSNRVMNQNYLAAAFARRSDGTYPTLGDAVRAAKNTTYGFFGDPVNNRKFTLLGDPAMTLAFPSLQVRLTGINGKPLGSVPDTLKAFSACTIQGEVRRSGGDSLIDFNGTVYAKITDKPRQRTTLGNDAGSPITNFSEEGATLFKGTATVRNGRFSVSFVVPRDIDYRYGAGNVWFYVDDRRSDGSGSSSAFLVGGTGETSADKEGPGIKAWLNDERFTDGSITHSQPTLLLRLEDSSGINIAGTLPGHDVTAVLDGDARQSFVLNKYYEADKDSYRSGRVRFTLPRISRGPHTLTIKAWDVVNNSATQEIAFRVEDEDKFILENVLNYPNPFTTRTTFWFDHNRPSEMLHVSVRIFTVSGRLVRTLRQTIFSENSRSSELVWDGVDEFGSRLGRGAYIYHLKVTAPDGKNAEQWQKLYIF